jgi:hypothetical protein
MNASNIVDIGNAAQSGSAGQNFNLQVAAPEDVAQFQDALSRNMSVTSGMLSPQPANGDMLGQKMLGRANELASGLMQDQQYVSKMLEKASRTGDSMQLMKAMMALNDYQIRVQTVTKTISKAAGAVDQLTKLQ